MATTVSRGLTGTGENVGNEENSALTQSRCSVSHVKHQLRQSIQPALRHAALSSLEQQKREAHAQAGLQVVTRIQGEVEQLRGQVAERQAALDVATAALRQRQDSIPRELGEYARVPQVAATMGDVLTDDHQKSSPQKLIASVAGVLDTLEQLRGSDASTTPSVWEISNVFAQLATQGMIGHILAGPEGATALLRIKSYLLAVADQERRRLAGLA
jgi:hypothetical protein